MYSMISTQIVFRTGLFNLTILADQQTISSFGFEKRHDEYIDTVQRHSLHVLTIS